MEAPAPPVDWWLADIPGDGLPAHDDCLHRRYRLTCGQFDRLLSRAAGGCEICRLPAEENARGKLHIDHDPHLGIWAVRGLLCHGCNATIRFPWMVDRSADYRANAFYLSLLAERGADLAVPPEPETLVTDHAGRIWRRLPQGWVADSMRGPSLPPQSWDRLVFRYGPHNLQPSSAAHLVTCPTCRQSVPGLLAICTRTAACVRAEIAADVAFERSQDR